MEKSGGGVQDPLSKFLSSVRFNDISSFDWKTWAIVQPQAQKEVIANQDPTRQMWILQILGILLETETQEKWQASLASSWLPVLVRSLRPRRSILHADTAEIKSVSEMLNVIEKCLMRSSSALDMELQLLTILCFWVQLGAREDIDPPSMDGDWRILALSSMPGQPVSYKKSRLPQKGTGSSDSSDTEIGPVDFVRLSALNALYALIQMGDREKLFSYWWALLPSSSGRWNLCWSARMDSSIKCRIAATLVLNRLLEILKPFLKFAQYQKSSASFVSLSAAIADDLEHLQNALLLHMQEERNSYVLIQLLHLVKTLVIVSPYYRLKTGLVASLVSGLKLPLDHKDVNVRVGVLTCFGTLLERHDPSILKDSIHPWLLDLCYKKCSESIVLVPLKVECLQVLSSIVKKFQPEPCNWDLILKSCFVQGSDPAVLQYGMRLMETCSARVGEEVWEEFVTLVVPRIMDDTLTYLKIPLCDCLAVMPARVLQAHLPHCFSVLMSLTKDPAARVSVAAIRALGLIVESEPVARDPFLIADISETLCAAMKGDGKSSDLVSQASWGLGNVSASLLRLYENGEKPELSLLKDMLSCILHPTKAKQAQAQCVRAMGTLLCCIDSDTFVHLRELASDAMKTLIAVARTVSNPKVKWNACNAIGNVFRNQTILDQAWTQEAIDVLCSIITTCDNLKTRQIAARALCNLESHGSFGSQYLKAIQSLLIGLETAMNDFSAVDLKVRDYLLDQLVHTLCHVLCLVDSDHNSVCQLIAQHGETVKECVAHFLAYAAPDKLTSFYAVKEKLPKIIPMLVGDS